MRLSRSLIAAAPLALACCVSPRQAPPPRPAPVATPRPAPTPAPVFTSWMDAPQTPGDWRYAATAGGSAATFGTGAGDAPFAIRCALSSRQIELVRSAPFAADAAMTVRTEALTRSVAGVRNTDGLHAAVSARDPLLDAMAFSKGRFAIEAPGAPTLYLPSWPEVTRVIEDCR